MRTVREIHEENVYKSNTSANAFSIELFGASAAALIIHVH